MRAFTMANDRMAASFERFVRYFRATNPRLRLSVIPFDDGVERIRGLCERSDGIDFYPACDAIDRIGQNVFGEEEYRPGIPAWRYVRKFNAFSGHDDDFVFMDCNCVPVHDMARLFNDIGRSPPDCLFGSRSSPNRTLRGEATQTVLTRLSPGLRTGYSCAFFISRGGSIDWHVLEAVTGARLRRLIGRSPEQGVLAFYMAVTGLTHQTVHDRAPMFANINVEELRFDGEAVRATAGKAAGRIKFAIKFTGQELKAEPEAARALLSALEARGRAPG